MHCASTARSTPPLPGETRGAHDTPSTRPLGASGLVEFDRLGDRAEHSSSFRLTNFQQSGPASVGRLGSGGLHLSRPIEWRDGNLPPRDARLSAGGDVVRTTLLRHSLSLGRGGSEAGAEGGEGAGGLSGSYQALLSRVFPHAESIEVNASAAEGGVTALSAAVQLPGWEYRACQDLSLAAPVEGLGSAAALTSSCAASMHAVVAPSPPGADEGSARFAGDGADAGGGRRVEIIAVVCAASLAICAVAAVSGALHCQRRRTAGLVGRGVTGLR